MDEVFYSCGQKLGIHYTWESHGITCMSLTWKRFFIHGDRIYTIKFQTKNHYYDIYIDDVTWYYNNLLMIINAK